MNSKIKFVYFDIGGVMFSWRKALGEVARKYQHSEKEVSESFAKYDEISCRGLISVQEIWGKVASDLHFEKYENDDIQSFVFNCFSPILETHVFVKNLIRKIPVGLLTNIHQGTYEFSLEKGLVPKLPYAEVIQSCQIGIIKPERAIYEHARKKAKVNHWEILFIDDLKINVEVAESLGWSTILFDSNNPKRSIGKIKEMLNMSCPS